MMVFPHMLIKAASEVGMKCPNLDNSDNFNTDNYPHFKVFCNAQLGVPMQPGDHWVNAKVIANIPNVLIKKVTINDLRNRGFIFHS